MSGKVYVVVSGKGGVGKTVSAINLGGCLNNFGKEAIVVDGNLSTPNIGIHLGSPIVPVTLNHVINNQAKPEEAIYEHSSGTKIIPASLSIDDLKNTDHHRIPDIAKRLRKIADYIIMDSSAGLGGEARSAIKASDEVILIANPELSSITDALKTLKIADQMRKDICGAIVTRHTGRKIDIDIPTIQDMLEIPILGTIPEDKAIKKSTYLKDAVIYTHPRSKAAKAYHKVTKKILGPEYYKKQAEKIASKKQSIFRRLFKRTTDEADTKAKAKK